MSCYDSPPRPCAAESCFDGSTHSPTSTTGFNVIEAENYRLEMEQRLDADSKRLARKLLRSKSNSFSEQARLLRQESIATEEVNRLEDSLQDACDHAIGCRIAMAEMQEAEEMKYIKFEVKILNLKLWEDLLKDPDCREIYAQKMKPRVRPFGYFSHLASSVTEWVKLRQKLEWIERVFVMSKFDELDPIENMEAMKKVLAKKADAIHKYNMLNEIVFEENSAEKEEEN